MDAAVYCASSPGGVKVTRVARPAIARPNEVLVKVKAAGLNPVDAKHVFGDKLPGCLRWLAVTACNGGIIGFDFSGVVLSAPKDSGFNEGDQVFGAQGPFRRV